MRRLNHHCQDLIPAVGVLDFSAEEMNRNLPFCEAWGKPDSAKYESLLFSLTIIKALNVLPEAVC